MPPLALLAILTAPACAPLLEFRDGPDRERLRRTAAAFCAALDAGDLRRVHAMFTGAMRLRLDGAAERGLPIPLTSGGVGLGCAPGRAWYLGGSRMFAEVVSPAGADRLDVWRGDWVRDHQLIADVVYGRPLTIEGRRVKTLSEALDVLAPAPFPERGR